MEIATEKELDARQVQYDAWIDKETKCSTRKSEIQEVLNFENYLGSELYGEFCSYRRDQDYSNDNYISDGLNNTDLFSNAREFIKTAQEELKKAATLQCNISCKVKNLFALDEFKPFWDSFQIGNWITVGYDNEYYRLRVISINGSLSDFSNIDVEFSSVTRISNVTTNIKDVLNQAQSMATNYSYISRQSNNGQKANDTLSEFQKKSINAALYMIKNNDEEGITIDNHGITARAWNDILGDFDPEQLIITHNVLGFTDDNFASLKTALGKVLMPDGTYKYGLNAEVVIGTFLLGKYLELENENGSLKFNGDGFVITNGINTFTVNPNNKEKLLSLSSNNVDVFYVDSNGKLHIQGDGAGLDITSNKTITDMSTKISQTADAITAEVNRAQKAEGQLDASLELKLGRDENDQVVSMINASADQIVLTGNRLIVECNNFELDALGRVHIIDSLLFDSGDAYGVEILGHDGRNNALLQNVMLDLSSVTSADGSFLATKDDIPDIPDMSEHYISELNYTLTYAKNVYFKGVIGGFNYNLATTGWCSETFQKKGSDFRLKKNISDLVDITDFYMKLKPKRYEFKDGLRGYDSRVHYGFIAQDIASIEPESSNLVYKKLCDDDLSNEREVINDDYVYYVDKDELHAMHVQMIQKQHKEIEQLKQDNISIKGEVDILKQRLGKMEEMLNVINSKIN